MPGSKANASAARRQRLIKQSKSGNYIGKESANPRSRANFRSAEPPSAASWPKRNLESDGLTQPCRKDTKDRSAPGHRSVGDQRHRGLDGIAGGPGRRAA